MIQRTLNTFLFFCTFLFSIAPAFSQTPPNIGYLAQISGLTSPIDIVNAGDGSNRLFVVQKGGTIRVYNEELAYLGDFLSVSGVATTPEGGLLSAAFHPDYESNGFVFVYYTRANDNSLEIARYNVSSADENIADPASKQVVLNIPHSEATNHNGGKILFGPDGYLYLATGDGGGRDDQFNNAQNGASLLGKMLRIDVNTIPYQIPPGNPYTSDDGIADEIWAMGLRNPFRWSFDRANGNMWIADVGQSGQEEINYRPNGATGSINYGWPCYEGTSEYRIAGCNGTYIAPVFVYGRNPDNGGNSITGGFVYRGAEFSSLIGYYIFADYGSGNQWVITPDRTQMLQLPRNGLPQNIVAFGEAEDGTVYAVSISGNTVYKVVDNDALPVTFGNINAFRKGNNLHIKWNTETESNNSHFEVQASTDGTTFTTIKTIASKASGGDSSTPIEYELQLNKEDFGVVLVVSVFAVLSLAGWKSRKKWGLVPILLAAIALATYSCTKNDLPGSTDGEQLFIRIAQVDKDGATQYSKTVQVINE